MMRNQTNAQKGISPHSDLFIDLLNSKASSKINLKHSFKQGKMEIDVSKRNKSPSARIDLSEDLSPASTIVSGFQISQ